MWEGGVQKFVLSKKPVHFLVKQICISIGICYRSKTNLPWWETVIKDSISTYGTVVEHFEGTNIIADPLTKVLGNTQLVEGWETFISSPRKQIYLAAVRAGCTSDNEEWANDMVRVVSNVNNVKGHVVLTVPITRPLPGLEGPYEPEYAVEVGKRDVV